MSNKFHRTKIIATVGPAIASEKMLEDVVQAGVDVFRFNFSHGEHKDYVKYLNWIRKLSEKHAAPIGIMTDVQGPKMRIGEFRQPGGVSLNRNDEFIITTRDILGTEKIVSTSFKELKNCVKSGDDIFLNDGLIRLSVKQVKADDVVCRVVEGGHLSDHKGINLPWTTQPIPILTEKDKKDIRFS